MNSIIKQMRETESETVKKNRVSLKYQIGKRRLMYATLRLSIFTITCILLAVSVGGCTSLMTIANSINEVANSTGGLKIKPISNQIDLHLESCVRDGKTVIITYYLKNNTGNNYRMINIGGSTSWCPNNQGEYTTIVDNLGNNYNTAIGDYNNANHELAGEKKREGSLNVNLPNGISVKGIYTIYNVNPAAKSFQVVNIAFDRYGGGNLCYDISYGFRDLPISEQ